MTSQEYISRFISKNVIMSADSIVTNSWSDKGLDYKVADYPTLFEGKPTEGEWICQDCDNRYQGDALSFDPSDRHYCKGCGIKLNPWYDFTPTEYEEVLEHWVVSEKLADLLESRDESITRDFKGLIIWGRTTSGQAIKLDQVIQDIYKECFWIWKVK